MQTAMVILAAGRGTRMQSDLPKVLHPIGGAPMLAHVLRAANALDPTETVVVTGAGGDLVEAALSDFAPGTKTVTQSEQLGTGHATAAARAALDGFDGLVMVLFGDTPFIRSDTLQAMQDAARTHDIVVLGFEPADPLRYGRLVTHGETVERIVEFKDASAEERAIRLCNGGLLACRAELLFSLLEQVDNDNAAGEYYLTSLPEAARAAGRTTGYVTCDAAETMGIDTRQKLAEAEAHFQTGARQALLETGVTLVHPDSVHLAYDTVIGRDALIEPNVVFGPGVTIESGATIRAFSHLEGAHVSRGAVIGPYARLRPGAELAEDVRIGNFVEVKAAEIGAGAKVNHLSYIGDATIGPGSNIGAGTITCNYDGVGKHRTEIGANVFVGSDTMLVAPVRLGDGSMTGSGSVITKDVPADALALSRAEQVTREGMAPRLFELARAKTAKSRKG